MWRREYLVELYDVGVSQYLQDAYFAGDSFDVSLFDNLFFLECFDCDFLIGGDVYA